MGSNSETVAEDWAPNEEWPDFIQVETADTTRNVPAVEGWSLMQILRDQKLVPGECGGMALCATCHIKISAEVSDAHQIPPIGSDEDFMLDEMETRKPESRLACQIIYSGDKTRGLKLSLGSAN